MKRRMFAMGVALALLAVAPVWGAMVLSMDLEGLCSRADKIYRGVVTDVETSTITVGGAELPTVIVSVAVSETLLGNPDTEKGVTTFTMIAAKPNAGISGGSVHFSNLPEPPDLQVGEEYLLLTTQPSSVGLSTTVGLGQGCFHIDPKSETAVNGRGNAGLSPSIDGPVSYSQLRDEINGLIGG